MPRPKILIAFGPRDVLRFTLRWPLRAVALHPRRGGFFDGDGERFGRRAPKNTFG
jgi:hypothetical protein